MKKYKWIVILINLILLLFFFNFSLIKKEKSLAEGKLLLLKLAPVDPRSLMQGDYMRLNYEISSQSYNEDIAKRGYCVLRIDENGIGQKVRLQAEKTPLNEGEYLVRYNYNNWNITIGAESFFFQEGDGEKYEKAKYGGLKLDESGTGILEGLYDENMKKIE